MIVHSTAIAFPPNKAAPMDYGPNNLYSAPEKLPVSDAVSYLAAWRRIEMERIVRSERQRFLESFLGGVADRLRPERSR
ncbi:hypothetical protein [Mesorhizobium sp.]|uniref:hypothetical protein n=1 Tax=Mesorhizobium sp. TaxID=1871066 RepID=UPI0025BC83F6|nr:hypothetical protein [Mesorhizobium sp.]